MQKKLYKSSRDKKLAGVCGGIAGYLNIDSTVIRLIWVIISLAYGTGIIAYIICALIMPDKPEWMETEEDEN
ncbi:PspC domain-containing protein [Schnuerera sp. xch1]|uniref:PspC domain-containing protein n=1 Tax=Schnuerera sp. xch1 TaxID=2874283 RepID=UPI001CC0A34F|nr:PspC domain-containing protein [Schnuerera sp. xch1]MBZ2174627.1 PspC domain-containing protein [Schnuerera sp. xch1]